jgi:hypothetical protein
MIARAPAYDRAVSTFTARACSVWKIRGARRAAGIVGSFQSKLHLR